MSIICEWFPRVASGISGFSIPNEHDQLAILQHYIGRSPVIHLTGTPEIALYFAFLGAESGRECVVYSVDQSASVSLDVVFSDHAFLVLPLEGGGLRHRWLRQDGYSVGPSNWRDIKVVQAFDLLGLPGVDSVCFTKGAEDDELIRYLGDLEDTSSDPLALAVRGTLSVLVRSLGLMSPGIQNIMRASKTRDPDAELSSEIDVLINVASGVGAPTDLLLTLKTLRSSVGTSHWQTSFDCTLDTARKQVHRLVSPSA